MKIECVPKDNDPAILVIHIDEEPWHEIHTTIFGRKPELPKNYSTLDDFYMQFEELEYKRGRVYAIKCLMLKSQLKGNLQKTLEKKCICKITAQRIVEECQKAGYLNDREWIEHFIQKQMAQRAGPQAILMKLRQKGVTEEQAKFALSKLDSEECQIVRVEELLNNRYHNRNLSDFREKQKVIASLARKGFSFSVIKSALEKNSEN